MEPIVLRGARQHNLRGFDLTLESGRVIVVTGPSGAGKSSLALDTLYAEGQRRYVESFSPYARQFLDRSQRPAIDGLESCPPAVAVDRAQPARSGRSTVATRTEIADHVKHLWARAATQICARCGGVVRPQRIEATVERLLERAGGAKAILWMPFPMTADAKGLLDAREALLRVGYGRVLRGGRAVDLAELRPSDLDEVLVEGALRVVVDRVVLRRSERRRIVEALEAASRFGAGEVGVDVEGRTVARGWRGRRCDDCGAAAPAPTPSLFSFNSPLGACPQCSGFGRDIEIDPEKVVDDPRLTIAEDPLRPFRGPKHRWERRQLLAFCRAAGIPTDVPWRELDASHRAAIWRGDETGETDWFGIDAWFEWMESRSYKPHVRIQLARYRRYVPCRACGGSRFASQSLEYVLEGKRISDLYGLDVSAARAWLARLEGHEDPSVRVLVGEIGSRLEFLDDVGLGYLTLDRMTRTLSGGEAQRVGLATALGASLTGTLFVIDEPTVGLHHADVPRLMGVVRRLADAGNVVLVVDNHPEVVGAADRIVELGPGAGQDGGALVFDGAPRAILGAEGSRTATLFEAGEARARPRRQGSGEARVLGARAHNLRGVDVSIPLRALTVVTGPSGSGKTTLVERVLVRGLRRLRGETTDPPGDHDALLGFDPVTELVVVDQSPLGRTSRGNPATYVKAWDVLRKRFAAEPSAEAAGLTASSFSFNVEGGRCESCRGEGVEIVEMQFLPDIALPCPVCGGRRFGGAALGVTLGGHTVAEVLEMTVSEVLARWPGDRPLRRRLEPLLAMGLGYLRIGQPLTTLSDGEAQRLKLARALSKVRPGSLIVLDEPTVGLHPSDVAPLVEVFHRLVDDGSTVLAVTHDMGVAAAADRVIDLGPGGGEGGGRVVAAGTPEEVRGVAESRTAPALGRALDGAPQAVAADGEDARRAVADEAITVRGAREHNLRAVDVRIPRGRFTAVTGPSGSGKSTLAFDIVHAEGQRRYLQSLSPYVRQYLRQLPRPNVDAVEGVPPSIALEPRRVTAGGATVATLTEVGHHLRLLFARAGVQHCPDCGDAVRRRSPAEIEAALRELSGEGERSLLARVVEHRKGVHKDVLGRARTMKLERVRVDGVFYETARPPKLARHLEHDVDFEIARLSPGEDLHEVVAIALQLGRGTVRVGGEGADVVLSVERSCPSCGRGFPPLDPTQFSPFAAHAACPTCEGSGFEATVDLDAVLERALPLDDGGLRLFALPAFRRHLGRRLRRIRSIPLHKRYDELDEAQRRWLLHGRGRWPGLIEAIAQLGRRRVHGADEMLTRRPCQDCEGTRLAPGPRHVVLGDGDDGKTFVEVSALSVESALRWISSVTLDTRRRTVGEELRRHVEARLRFLGESGVGYLQLDRAADSLSGGETQRVRLAAQLGAGLAGVAYVLDEPTIGLHARDTGRLVQILRRLARQGATVLVVEHDEQIIRAADHVIDLGPGGGVNGGRVVARGAPKDVEVVAESPTGALLARPGLPPVGPRRALDDAVWITLRGVSARNLKGIDVAFPQRRLTAVTGVSGSGKSTLVREVLQGAVRRELGRKGHPPAQPDLDGIEGVGGIDRVVEVDQSPIGRTPRSVPATYVGVFGAIRSIFARTPESRSRGWGPQRYSFNREGGRCEACGGQGAVRVEMSFLPEVQARCDACGGSRFGAATREVTFRGLSIDRVLDLTVDEALEVFGAFPKIVKPLQLLVDLGLGYLTLGQPSNTLSGGEAQRLKLVSELGQGARSRTLYLLDEPTTGLHGGDVARLVAVLQRLVERGDTVVVIEHHLDVVWAADHVIDLGPEGGEGGGEVVFVGPPASLAEHETSHTGAALRAALSARALRSGLPTA